MLKSPLECLTWLTPQDDGFHEIQLNGKQLVFLFMAATVVSVVIFLCGVLVGRGVRAERGESTRGRRAEPRPSRRRSGLAAPAGADARGIGPDWPPPLPHAVDDLSYFNRLDGSKPAARSS